MWAFEKACSKRISTFQLLYSSNKMRKKMSFWYFHVIVWYGRKTLADAVLNLLIRNSSTFISRSVQPVLARIVLMKLLRSVYFQNSSVTEVVFDSPHNGSAIPPKKGYHQFRSQPLLASLISILHEKTTKFTPALAFRNTDAWPCSWRPQLGVFQNSIQLFEDTFIHNLKTFLAFLEKM